MSSKSARSISRPRPWSLAARLTAWYAGTSFALVLVASGLLYFALSRNLDQEDDQVLADKVNVLQAILRDLREDTATLRHEVEREWSASQYEKVYVRIVDATGKVVLETPGMAELVPQDAFPKPTGEESGRASIGDTKSTSGKAFRMLASRSPVGLFKGEAWVIQAALNRNREEELLVEYRKRLWVILSAAFVACTLVGYWIARFGIRPVHRMAEKASTIGSATLNERIESSRFPSELSTLAETFNAMLDRLEGSFDRLSRFSADIAHELRTPVNNLRGEIEVALGRDRPSEEYREVLGSCLEECARLTRIIDTLLFLARSESPEAQVHKERLDVKRELEAVREFYEATAEEKGVVLTASTEGGIEADLDRVLLQQALGNLVENALTHSTSGGTVSMHAGREGSVLRVEVADTGCGIPPAHLPHVFDRFYSVDGSRSSASGGMGLGLALVKSIVVLHGGSVEATSEVGVGTRISIRFPSGAGAPDRLGAR